jgi:hypothetical protein
MRERLVWWYTALTGAAFLLQSTSAYALGLFPLSHAVLHFATGVVAMVALWRGGRAPGWFALGLGGMYCALAAVGVITQHSLGLALTPADHGIHLAVGLPALVVGVLARSGWVGRASTVA